MSFQWRTNIHDGPRTSTLDERYLTAPWMWKGHDCPFTGDSLATTITPMTQMSWPGRSRTCTDTLVRSATDFGSYGHTHRATGPLPYTYWFGEEERLSIWVYSLNKYVKIIGPPKQLWVLFKIDNIDKSPQLIFVLALQHVYKSILRVTFDPPQNTFSFQVEYGVTTKNTSCCPSDSIKCAGCVRQPSGSSCRVRFENHQWPVHFSIIFPCHFEPFEPRFSISSHISSHWWFGVRWLDERVNRGLSRRLNVKIWHFYTLVNSIVL